MKTPLLSLLIVLIMVSVASTQHAQNLDKYEEQARQLVQKMTLEEKAGLLSGRDQWTTKPVERLDIPAIWLSDGPHGLRRAPVSTAGGYGNQLPATSFPTASALAATWNTDLIEEVGHALGQEAQAMDVDILLGPGVNIKRSPRGGRNFEYFSEDPVLSGKIGAAFIHGVQAEGVGTCLKHFAINNQETKRMLMNSEVDRRTMHEIYLRSFEIPIREANPWSVMAAYNRINGTYGTQHPYLLQDVLRDEFEFNGIVVSDWVSVVDRVKSLKAGMNLEMPTSDGVNDQLVVEAVNDGSLSEDILDKYVTEIVKIVLLAQETDTDATAFDTLGHHQLAKKTAAEAIVLLKNERQVLPLTSDKYKNVLVIGEIAKEPRIQGYGSSETRPSMLESAWENMTRLAGDKIKLEYIEGYDFSGETHPDKLVSEAQMKASEADAVVIFAGYPFETEGVDKESIDLPEDQNELISAVAEKQQNTVVVTVSGSVVEMPWNNLVPSMVHHWLAGQAGGAAMADILFGETNPSGKLAESFIENLEDASSYLNFPGEQRNALYGERYYVGYRYYDEKNVEPLFPFGHGLSYTSFEYSNLKPAKTDFRDSETLRVELTVKNTGSVAGKETIQLYVHDQQSSLPRPVKELKTFGKVALEPGEEKVVTFDLSYRDFAYYDDRREMWIAETGAFDLLAGASSRDIRLTSTVNLQATREIPLAFDEYTFLSEYLSHPKTRELTQNVFREWLMQQAGENQSIDEVQIHDFIADQPLIKFPYITKGVVTRNDIDQLILKVKNMTFIP